MCHHLYLNIKHETLCPHPSIIGQVSFFTGIFTFCTLIKCLPISGMCPLWPFTFSVLFHGQIGSKEIVIFSDYVLQLFNAKINSVEGMPAPILPDFPLSVDLIAECDLATQVLSQAYKSPSKSLPFFHTFRLIPLSRSFNAMECIGLLSSPPVQRVLMDNWRMIFWHYFHHCTLGHIPSFLPPVP